MKQSILSTGVRLAGLGSYLPERILTNADLEKMVSTSDEWITSRTGIKERRIAASSELASDLGSKAALQALEKSGVKAEELDLIICASISPDMIFPSTACLIQQKIGAFKAAAFDLQAACSGFLYSFIVASNLIRSGAYRNILVIGSERVSSALDWADRNTCILFGDGAGAAVLQASEKKDSLLSWALGADGRQGHLLYYKNSSSGRSVGTTGEAGLVNDYVFMNGKEVFKHAVLGMVSAAHEVLEKAGCTINDIRCVIPHQANFRIIEAIGERLKIPPGVCFVNLQRYGNISSACIPVALQEASVQYAFAPGDKILLMAFGGGLTWAAAVLEW